MKLNNTLYTILKYMAMTGLPVLKVFIPRICSIWGLEYGQQLGDTLDAIHVALAGFLMISIATHNETKNEETKG